MFRPELSTGQEDSLSVQSTKHFKEIEDWERQQDDGEIERERQLMKRNKGRRISLKIALQREKGDTARRRKGN